MAQHVGHDAAFVDCHERYDEACRVNAERLVLDLVAQIDERWADEEACKITLRNHFDVDEFCKLYGKKSLKSVEQKVVLQCARIGNSNKPRNVEYACETCMIQCNSKTALTEHLRGKRHKKRQRCPDRLEEQRAAKRPFIKV